MRTWFSSCFNFSAFILYLITSKPAKNPSTQRVTQRWSVQISVGVEGSTWTVRNIPQQFSKIFLGRPVRPGPKCRRPWKKKNGLVTKTETRVYLSHLFTEISHKNSSCPWTINSRWTVWICGWCPWITPPWSTLTFLLDCLCYFYNLNGQYYLSLWIFLL